MIVGPSKCNSPQFAPPARRISDAALEQCRELQNDELLALEATYDSKFRYYRSDDGQLVCKVTIDVDLQDTVECIVVEEAVSRAAQAHEHAMPGTRLKAPLKSAGRNGNRSAHSHSRQYGQKGRAYAHASMESHSHPPNRSESRGHTDVQTIEPAPTPVRNGGAMTNGAVQESMTLPPTSETTLAIQHLLPVELIATLHQSYPLYTPPALAIECSWLSKYLANKLLGRITPYEISTVIADSSFLQRPLRIVDRYEWSASTRASRPSLVQQLVTHDRLVRHSTFSAESFACGICLETKKGARCARLKRCGHVFCVECLHSFWELNIREGLVANVTCADMECVQKRAKAVDPSVAKAALPGSVGADELEAIVGKDLADRYTWLVEKQRIESDPTITYCPRSTCNAAVPKESDEDQADSIVDKYVNGTDEEKAAVEVRYGKTNVQKLVEAYLEEQANSKWIADNSTRCPDCQYIHFSTPGTSCYNKLFEYVPSDAQINEALFEAMVADDH
ncbi:hypothetical protein EMMF5_002893 [Cystobasidiomycetes sp. EMM_F5]